MAVYSDLNREPCYGEAPLVTDIEAIYQSIDNILSTKKGERLFLPEFYADLENLLFEPVDDITSMRILDAVLDAIERWEPRVQLLYPHCEVNPLPDDNAYEVVLVFRVVGLEGQTFEYRGLLRR